MSGDQVAGKKRRASVSSHGGGGTGKDAVDVAGAAPGRPAKKPRASLDSNRTNGKATKKSKSSKEAQDASAGATTADARPVNGEIEHIDEDADDAAANAASMASVERTTPQLTPAAALAGLRSTSLDALRIILSDIRTLTAVSAGEQTDLLPPTDARVVFATAIVKGAGDESMHTAGPIFDVWDVAEQRGALTLIPIIQNVLTNLLRLLTMHSPTHPLGEAIIRRVLPSRSSSSEHQAAAEPYFSRIQGYIAGTQRPVPSQGGGAGASKGFSQDALVISSLRLLAEMVSFNQGKCAREVFDNFNWGLKSLSKLLTARRRQHISHKRKGGASQQPQAASITRPDTRTAFIMFYLSFLRPIHLAGTASTTTAESSTKSGTAAKVGLLALPARDFHTPLLKGLAEDAPSVVAYMLEALHSGLLSDSTIPRASLLAFFNEWNCAHLLALYQRQWEIVPTVSISSFTGSDRPSIAQTGPSAKRPSVAELTHHFMLSLCTHPGFGICFRDDSWYPRGWHSRNAAGQQAAIAPEDDEEKEVSSKSANGASGAGTTRSLSSSSSVEGGLYNKILLGVLRQLAPTRSLPQQELAIRILEACPELVGPYLTSVTSSSPAGIVISLEPRAASSAYVTSLAWLYKIFSLPIPSFPSASSSTPSKDAQPALPLDERIAYRAQAPPLQNVLASLLPSPLLSRAVLLRACFHSDRLVRHQASSLLSAVLDRMRRFNEVCMRASESLGEDVSALHRRAAHLNGFDDEDADVRSSTSANIESSWAGRCRDVQQEARKILPDLDSFVAAIQSFGQPPTTPASKSGDATSSDASLLLLEVNLRVLWLYFTAVPHATFDSTFDVGKLLLSRFMAPIQAQALPTIAPESLDTAKGSKPAAASEDEGAESRKATKEAERQLGRMCQLHALRIVTAAATSSGDRQAASSTDFVKTAVGGGLALSVSSFDIFTRPSSTLSAPGPGEAGSIKTYFTALLSLVLSSPSEAVQNTCTDLLRSAMADSVLFQHDRREWDVWMAVLPSSDAQMNLVDSSATTSIASATLTSDQATVLGFFDDCLTRTLRLPYRYIETSRRFLSEVSDSDETALGEKLAGSPLLHAMVEQFCIRCRKRILDPVGSTNADGERLALIAFFTRLICMLAARGVPLAALQKLAADAAEAAQATESEPTPALTWASKVLEASVDRLHSTTASQQSRGQTNGSAPTSTPNLASHVKDATDVSDLRRVLRTASRPLTKADVQVVLEAAARFWQSGIASAAQLLGELHPVEENLGVQDHVWQAASSSMASSSLCLPALVHLDSARAARLIGSLDHEEQQYKILGAVVALARLHSSSESAASGTEQQLKAHVELLEACIRAGINDDDLREVLFQQHGVLRTSQASEEWKGRIDILVALASSLSPGNPTHAALMSPVATKVIKELLSPARSLDVNTLKPVVLFLPFCDDKTLAWFAQAMLQKVLEDRKLAKPIASAGLAAVHRALVLCPGDAVASQVVSETIGKDRIPVDASRFIKLELVDLVGLALNEMTLPGILTEATSPASSALSRPISEVKIDNDFVEGLVGGYGVDIAAKGMAPIIYRSQRLAQRVWQSALVTTDDIWLRAGLSSLFASVDVLSQAREVPDCVSNASQEEVDLLLGRLASTTFLNDSSQSATSAAVLTKLIEMAPELTSRISAALVKAVRKENRLAFSLPAISSCIACMDVRPMPDARGKARSPVTQLCAKLIPSGLLWIVRRFAEDAGDSPELLKTISTFRQLLLRSATLAVEVPPAVAEPVIEAGITCRWNELEPMKLVEVLCERTKLTSAAAGKIIGRLAVAMSTTRLLLLSDASSTELETTWSNIVCAMAKHGPDSLRAAMPLLAVRYRGRLGEVDMQSLGLLQQCENTTGTSVLGMFWSIVNQGNLSSTTSNANPGLEILSSLNAAAILKTCTSYPRWRPLFRSGRPHDASSDENLFDPLFILVLANAAIVDPSFKGLDIVALLRTNALGVAVCALSSQCSQLRAFAALILARARAITEVTTLNEQGHLLLILDALKNTQTSADEGFEPLPLTTTLFLAHALQALANPSHFTYPLFTRFLLQRPVIDDGDLPMLYNMLSSSSESSVRERDWMLRFLRDCIRSGGRLEWRIFKRRHVWELICSLYTSSIKGEGRNSTIRELLLAVAQLPHAGKELLGRKHVLAWMTQAIALSQRPKTVASPFWLRLAATLLDKRSGEEVDNLTQGFWSAEVISILNECVPSDTSGNPLGAKALHDAATLCARLVAHWQGTEIQCAPVRANLIRLLDSLVAHASRSRQDASDAGPDAQHTEVARILFQSVLSLQPRQLQAISQPPPTDPRLVKLFTSVLTLALAAQVPETRHLAVRNLS